MNKSELNKLLCDFFHFEHLRPERITFSDKEGYIQLSQQQEPEVREIKLSQFVDEFLNENDY